MTIFERIYFSRGEAAKSVLDVLDKQGPEPLLRSLAGKLHDSGHHETAAEQSHGADDDVFEMDDYLLWWNSRIGYVGLDYRIDDVGKKT